MPAVTVRLSDLELELLDEQAALERATRSDVLRAALISHRAVTGTRQQKLEAFARELLVQHGEDAVLTVRVNASFNAEAFVNGHPTSDVDAMAVADIGGTLQLLVGDEKSDARARIGIVPMSAGFEASLPIALLPTVGVVDVHDD